MTSEVKEDGTYDLYLPDSGCGIVHTWYIQAKDEVEVGQKLGEGESAESELVPITCPRAGVVQKLIPVGRHVKQRCVPLPTHSAQSLLSMLIALCVALFVSSAARASPLSQRSPWVGAPKESAQRKAPIECGCSPCYSTRGSTFVLCSWLAL